MEHSKSLPQAEKSWDDTASLVLKETAIMSSEQPVIYLEEAWDETITKKALNPLEEMLEKGVDKKKKLFNNKEYIDIYS